MPAPTDSDALLRVVTGALRACINDHGPITAEHIGSAAKRIVGSLKNVGKSNAQRPDHRRRFPVITGPCE